MTRSPTAKRGKKRVCEPPLDYSLRNFDPDGVGYEDTLGRGTLTPAQIQQILDAVAEKIPVAKIPARLDLPADLVHAFLLDPKTLDRLTRDLQGLARIRYWQVVVPRLIEIAVMGVTREALTATRLVQKAIAKTTPPKTSDEDSDNLQEDEDDTLQPVRSLNGMPVERLELARLMEEVPS